MSVSLRGPDTSWFYLGTMCTHMKDLHAVGTGQPVLISSRLEALQLAQGN